MRGEVFYILLIYPPPPCVVGLHDGFRCVLDDNAMVEDVFKENSFISDL